MIQHLHHVRDLAAEVPQWAVTVMACMAVILILTQIGIMYTYGCVVATLAMIESTTTTAVLAASPAKDDEVDNPPPPPYTDDEDVKKPLLLDSEVPLDPEVLLVTPKPITSSLRGTIRHLETETGSHHARSRGAGISILFGILSHCAYSVLVRIFPYSYMFRLGSYLFVQLMLCRVNMLWTHVVISKPSSKPWYRRRAPRSSIGKIAPETMAAAILQIASAVIPMAMYTMLDMESYAGQDIRQLDDSERVILALKAFAVFLSFVSSVVLIVIPVQVAFTRCQAALLADDETPIVPFDRTFGGYFVSESEGGSGKLRLKDAWRSFDYNARVRLAKVWLKMFAMQVRAFVVYLIGAAIVVTVVKMTAEQ